VPNKSLVDHLVRQLSFLRHSCASFDAGFIDEAIRIAVVIRTLAHDTTRSSSLLSQIGSPNIHLLSTCPEIEPNTIMFSGGLSTTQVKIENGKLVHAIYQPLLDSGPPTQRLLPWKDWWRQIVYLIDVGSITRRQIVLGAANKDGGAHVDPKLTAEYEALCRGVMSISYKLGGQTGGFPIQDVHLSDLRQMAHELLHSHDILALAR